MAAVIFAAKKYEQMRGLNRRKTHLGADAKKNLQVKETAEHFSFVDSNIESALSGLRFGT